MTTQTHTGGRTAIELLDLLDGMDHRQQIITAFEWVSTYGDAATAVDQLCSCGDTHSRSKLIASIAFFALSEHATTWASLDEPCAIIKRSLQGAVGVSANPFNKHAIESVEDTGFPVWPTGCRSLDMDKRGGYGLAAIVGEPGVGKSFFGISCAVEAVRAGWTVAHFDAESGHRERLKRLFRYAGSIDDTLRDNLHLFSVTTGATPALMLESIEGILTPDTQRLLIIGDSINRITNMSAVGNNSNDYWNAFAQWVEFGRESARQSEGLVSFCWVGELNKAGRDKGEQLGYAANYIVRIREGDSEGLVEIDNMKSRDSRRSDAMVYRRDWSRARFVFEGVE